MEQQPQNTILHIEGMDCANCAAGITKSLQKSGMENVHVDFATGEASFYLQNKNILPPAIKEIQSLGYKVIDSKIKEANEGKRSTIERRFFATIPFTVVLFFSHMLLPHDFLLNQPIVQLLICIPVFVIGLIQFGKSAFGSVKIGVPNMDVLIFIGSSAAFIYSVIGMYLFDSHQAHNYLFFETTATIITLVLLGNVLEQRSVKQTTSAIKELTSLNVSTAKIVGLQFGKEVVTEINYKDIPVGALLQVNSGDKVPVDGELISGEASIDEALFLDMDFAILGAPPAIYAEYAENIRAEYAHVPDDRFRAGRGAFLKAILAQPNMFRTALYERELGAQARANIRSEIMRLSA